jgi:hypothetical protein
MAGGRHGTPPTTHPWAEDSQSIEKNVREERSGLLLLLLEGSSIERVLPSAGPSHLLSSLLLLPPPASLSSAPLQIREGSR